ncbi:hypothetical protein [uncultured Ruminococcus sp.]|uniref:hypothetical protein n=1 Tax=uncultured Ruminococcus sp. TaxID=165186 RepID=UPI0020554185|nr:hypothetical protein [uncultured Ruminococcus sp.]DAL37426.1 MAG TPA_asm: hypothetical protein [Caudoviricetes sp.]
MTIKLDKGDYIGMLKYLLSLPMNRADKPMLAYLYTGGGIPEVLGETVKELRVRVAMNAVKAHCDENTSKGEEQHEHRRVSAEAVPAVCTESDAHQTQGVGVLR